MLSLPRVKTPRSGFWALFLVYFIWGSSFLAIRLAVSGAGSFQPYSLAAIRTLSAGLLLLAWAGVRGDSLRIGWTRFRWLALTGILLWVGGHTLVIWAERRMESGLAALLFASTPLWAAMLEGLRGRGFRAAPVIAGFVGVTLVLPPATLGPGLWVDAAVLLISAFFWAFGTVLGEGPAAGLPIPVATGIQLTVAGLVTSLLAYEAGESAPAPDLRAFLACAYLIFFGTVLAYLAYSHALRTLPVAWLMSFGYVNPVVAVALGALVLGERVEARSALGISVVVGSVIWLFAGSAPQKAARGVT